MLNWNRTFITIIATLELAACSYKVADKGSNDGPVSSGLTVAPVQDRPDGSGKVQIMNVDLTRSYNAIIAAKTPEALEQEISVLEKIVLSPQNYLDQTQIRTDTYQKALSYYNYAITELVKKNAKSEQLEAVFARFEKMAFAGCDSALKGCMNVSLLRLDERSSKVLQLMASHLDQKLDAACKADCGADLKKYYNYLGLAFDTNNMVHNIELEFLYIKRAQDYGAYIKKDPTIDASFFKKHGAVFEEIISRYPADPKNQDFVKFVSAFKPWNYSRMNENPFPFGTLKMFNFAATNFLYDKGSKKLNSQLQSLILENQKVADSKGPSFSMIVKSLIEQTDSKAVLQNLGMDVAVVTDPTFFNEYFYMIDGLYRGRFGLEEANSLWQGSKKDEKELLRIVNNYVRIVFIQQSVLTNRFIGGIYLQPDIPNDILFKQVIQKSEPQSKDWAQVVSQTDNISLFFTQQLRNSKTSTETLSRAQQMIARIPRDAKFVSVATNELVLTYFMLQLQASINITTWWGGNISIEPSTIMAGLLGGQSGEPWFRFGGDSSPLDQTGVIYALYYALNGGSFDSFAVVKDSQGKPSLNRPTFFKKALASTMQADVDSITDSIHNLESLSANNSDFADFMNICNNETAGKKDYTVSMKLEDLRNFSIFGDAHHGILKQAFESYKSGGIASYDSIRNMNLYESRLVQIRAMADILLEDLGRNIQNDPNAAQGIASIKSDLANIESVRGKFLTTALKQHRLISDCMNRLQQLERERQSTIFTKEIDYLGKIWDALSTLKTFTGDSTARAAKVAELKKTLALQDNERIDADVYSYTHLDLLNRLANYAGQLTPNINFESPDDQTKSTLTSQLEMVQFIHPVTHQVIPREQFINAGMSLYNPGNSSYLQWLVDPNRLDGWQAKIDAMNMLYILGFDVQAPQDPKFTVTADEIIQENILMAKSINILDSEKGWLARMGRRERISRDEMMGFIFSGSETVKKGILDSSYGKIMAVVNPAYDFSKSFYNSSYGLGEFILPPRQGVRDGINSRYTEFALRPELMLNEFNRAVLRAEANLDTTQLNVVYRVEGGVETNYAPTMIDNGISKLLKHSKLDDSKAKIINFYQTDTGGFFKVPDKKP